MEQVKSLKKEVKANSSEIKKMPKFIIKEKNVLYENGFDINSGGCQRISNCSCDCNKLAGSCRPFYG